MATEPKLASIYIFPAMWTGGVVQSGHGRLKKYDSYDEIPQWLMERIVVLRLLEQKEPSPLGVWRVDAHNSFFVDHDYWIVRQPDDPEWEERQ